MINTEINIKINGLIMKFENLFKKRIEKHIEEKHKIKLDNPKLKEFYPIMDPVFYKIDLAALIIIFKTDIGDYIPFDCFFL